MPRGPLWARVSFAHPRRGLMGRACRFSDRHSGWPREQRRGRSHSNRSARMTKRANAKHKIDRRLGENIWGRPKSPRQQAREAPGPAWRAPRGQAVRLRPAAARQAEAQGLLRQHRRAAVPQDLRGGPQLQGLDVGADDRSARAPPRRGRLSRQVRADRVRRPPVRQPWPHQGERQAGQHPELSLQGRRRDRGQGEVARAGAGRSRRPRVRSATFPTIWRPITPR